MPSTLLSSGRHTVDPATSHATRSAEATISAQSATQRMRKTSEEDSKALETHRVAAEMLCLDS